MRRIIVGFLLLAAFALALVLTPPSGARSLRVFDPDRLADLEAGMWQAYYAKQRTRLFGLLVTLLHEQYHYSWAVAAVEGFQAAFRVQAIVLAAAGLLALLLRPVPRALLSQEVNPGSPPRATSAA